MLDVADLPVIYTSWRNRYHDRDNRMELIDRVITGDFGVFDPEDEPIESRSPNFVQVALEDTAEAASLMPTLRVEPSGTTSGAKKRAVTMEKVGTSYLDISKMDLLVPQTVMDMAAFGYGVWVVWPRFDLRAPVIERRDPRTCYPELGHRPGDPVERAFFCRQVPYTSLPEAYKITLSNYLANNARITTMGTAVQENIDVVLVEWFDQEEMVVAALYQASGAMMTGTPTPTSYIPVELERIPNKTGMCPVVIGSRFSIDGEFRGQFDQVIGVLNAHIRLTGMLLDYADQAVYSDIWVKDLIGEMPFGGGAYIELGPQGSIGRVAPAVSSLNVQQDLANLVEGFHVGGRWPKSRPGEIDQSIASAKFLESSAGMMNTAIRTYHMLLKHMMEQSLRVSFELDRKLFPGEKTASGILRNQQFLLDYDTKDIDPESRLRVEYGLGLGKDPSQSAVMMIQYAKEKYISRQFVQENIDGLTDVERERRRIDVEQLQDMALAEILTGLQNQQIPQDALVKIAQARANGEDLFDLFQKYIVQPKQDNAQQGLQSGMTGETMPPGPPGQAALPTPGGPPMPGPTPPPPPGNPLEAASRLSVNLPGRTGFLSTQT
jgi:hypothetical protein